MSDNGVTIEQIADLVGHRTTIVTQKVYRHQLKPVISTGATAMNTIFGNKTPFSCQAVAVGLVSAGQRVVTV